MVARRIRRETGSPPSAHQARPTATAPSPTETARMSVSSPQIATNGSSTIAGSGGNGSNAPVEEPSSSLSG